MRYQVIVGNIGTVYDGTSKVNALKDFEEYKEQSESGVGRAGGENVVLFENGEPIKQFTGTLSQQHSEQGD
jgi:hypothetical protein